MDAVVLVSHGSRSAKTKREVTALVKILKARTGKGIFEYAFLEIESPSIPEGVDLCVRQGATKVIVLLNFLNSGRHVDQDIPDIVKRAQQKHPGVHIALSQPVGQHPDIVPLFIDLINNA